MSTKESDTPISSPTTILTYIMDYHMSMMTTCKNFTTMRNIILSLPVIFLKPLILTKMDPFLKLNLRHFRNYQKIKNID